ncbi:DedD protein [Methylobacillus rhizosphaerae]|uniref:DedD protein n=1 Tax=Methylobacillus rhizosphaerae TaxID=551994 RepID=A0A238YHN7_9PROT|nr:SPOR domain-containing protein [Methylobacillus rhizosphaerae]SNR70590.1 DedD protein [Methylobacillus rhizosphaerae]
MASDQSNDQELQFKKRARRRLVGAVALVLLMVTILPMVLDDRSSKTLPQDIAIHIPSQDGPEFSSKIEPSTEPSEEIVSEPVLNISEPQDDDQDDEAPAPRQEAAKPVVPQPVKKETPKPEVKPVAPKMEAAKPAPVKEKPAAQPVAAGSFIVQVGVFSDQIAVKGLQDKLSDQGLKSYTENVATANGNKTRLRVGPFGSRDAADKALGKVKAAGLPGMVMSNK